MSVPSRRTLAAALTAASLAAGCAGPLKPPSPEQVRQAQNPVDRAQRTSTHFTPALRCMDELLFGLGTRDVTLMMEELRDATQKVPVSARDMMTSAISDMTRRSRAVRLSVFGADQPNLTQLLQLAQRTQPFSVVPEFNVRGSISQFDEDVRRQSSSLGVLAQTFGLRVGSDARFSVLGFDAAVVRTESMTLVPGVASKNTTVIARRESSAGDGQARLLGAGTSFSFAAARAEGSAQAARNMVELAAIELVGKLVRAPYWQCLGLPEEHPEVQRETEDWFLAMDEQERTVFVKERLRERRWFDGALDGSRGPAFEHALAAYRAAAGLPAGAPLDLGFFRQFVGRPPPQGPLGAPAARVAAPAAASTAPASTAAAPAETAPAAVAAEPSPPLLQAAVLAQPGGRAELRVQAAAAGYVYCYAQDPSGGAIRRVFPNRFAKDPRIEAGRMMSVPGSARFTLDSRHRFACLHAPLEVYNSLPSPLRWGDFDEVRLPDFDQIRQAFTQSSGMPVVLARAQVINP